MRSVRDLVFYSQDSSIPRLIQDCLGRNLGSGFPQYAKASGRISWPGLLAGLNGNMRVCGRLRPFPGRAARRRRLRGCGEPYSFGRRDGRPGPSRKDLPSGHRGRGVARVSPASLKPPGNAGLAVGRDGSAAGGRSRGDGSSVGRGFPVRGSLLRRQRRRSRCEGPAWRAVGRNVPPLFRPGA
jgi:hypothetical protein